MKREGSWLPEDWELRLTAFEAGFLHGLLSRDDSSLQVNVRGRRKPMLIKNRLLEKLWAGRPKS